MHTGWEGGDEGVFWCLHEFAVLFLGPFRACVVRTQMCVHTRVRHTTVCTHTHLCTCTLCVCVCVCVCVRMSGTNLYSFLREHACALTGTFTKFREGLCPQNSQTPVLYTPRCSRRSRQSSSPLQSPHTHTHTHTYTRVYACMHACMHVQERVCIRQSSRPLQTVTDRCRDHANVCLALGVLMHGETPSLVCCTPRCARRSNKIDFVRMKPKRIQTVK